MSEAGDTIKHLYKQVKDFNAGSIHMVMNKIYKDENACAVIGVYDGEKPPHLVLEELYEWAVENDFKVITDKIEELESDLSFLNKE